jgi:hypothetical protein
VPPRTRTSLLGGRLDDALVACALAVVAGLCASFRYLPMVDLPQHYAMVSILVHHADPAFGFAQRYTFDFVGRPYATVYWLGAGLAHVMPLDAAMRVVVAVCTIAPFAGTHALLAAADRPRVWLLAAIPLAFGSLWHWGFLNFLLGTGLYLGGLALVIQASKDAAAKWRLALFALATVVFFTHFHGLVMLLLFAPSFAWAFLGARASLSSMARTLAPLVPSAIAAVLFVAFTWSQAEGAWARMNPDVVERVSRFQEFLATGLRDPWPAVWLFGLVGVAIVGIVLGESKPAPARARVAFGLMLAAQVAMYFVLPLNTNTATYVSARHALLCVLCALPLLPSVEGRGGAAVRVLAGGLCGLALVVSGQHLASFDREAHDFDAVEAAMKPNRRVASLIFDRWSEHVSSRTFPYLHFAAYYQAALGGELARSFAVVWNVPIRYRSDYSRYPIDEAIEWAPSRFSPRDLAHFDYVLVRGGPPRIDLPGVDEVARSGSWRLLENPAALPPELPAP